MTLIDQGQRDFEAEQHPLISAPRHINLTLEDPRPDERRLRRAYQGFPRKMHGLQVLDSRKTAKNAVDVRTLTAVGCSKTSKLICSLISPKGLRSAPS